MKLSDETESAWLWKCEHQGKARTATTCASARLSAGVADGGYRGAISAACGWSHTALLMQACLRPDGDEMAAR
eukprot:6197690-Pleurochrysis_carterae.AAC.2